MKDKVNIKEMVKLSAAFCAFMIGSGYASGQEIMQFYTSMGWKGVFGSVISLAIFMWAPALTYSRAILNRDLDGKMSYKYFCGKIAGTFFEWFVPIFFYLVFVVLLSGAGATLDEYLGINHNVGVVIMSLFCVIVVILGLQKLVDVISLFGPFIIAFVIIIPVVTIVMNFDGFAFVNETIESANMLTASNSWILSAILYPCYCMVGSLIFWSAMANSATTSRKTAYISGLLGGFLVMGAAVLMNLGMLCTLNQVFEKSIPSLYLARLISPILGIVFFVILMLGIFSTAAPMFWTSVNAIAPHASSKRNIVTIVLGIIACLGGLIPFGKLVNIIYPLSGYFGIVLFIFMLVKEARTFGRKMIPYDEELKQK